MPSIHRNSLFRPIMPIHNEPNDIPQTSHLRVDNVVSRPVEIEAAPVAQHAGDGAPERRSTRETNTHVCLLVSVLRLFVSVLVVSEWVSG